MPIEALPKATSQLLSSGQVLTGPTSLVKELLDNAIDAQATSVEISISANTIDKLEVRDNGRGIAPDDLKLIGRHGYTSKLRSFKELETIGGSTLGFRGEALASAVELGQVTITTRTDGETVGTMIKLKATGDHDSSKASHPVGTTVQVWNIFARLPVRKQTTLKDAAKSISAIKQLLKAYALARLTLRLSFKVYKEPKHAWYYVPRSIETIQHAVSTIFGKGLAEECVTASFLEERVNISMTNLESVAELMCESQCMMMNHEYSLLALAIRKDVELRTIHRQGQYISIDGRPVSSLKGVPKKIVSAYRSYIRSVHEESSDNVRDSFLLLNITCEKGKYDVNIEPAKDEVLFEDDDALLSVIYAFFRRIYGDKVVKKPQVAAKKTGNDFSLLLSRPTPSLDSEAQVQSSSPRAGKADTQSNGPAILGPKTSTDQDLPSVNDDISSARGRRWDVDMSEMYEAEELSSQTPEPPSKSARKQFALSGAGINENVESQEGHSSSLNPWIIAKLNSSNPARQDFSDKKSSALENRASRDRDSESSLTSPYSSLSFSTSSHDLQTSRAAVRSTETAASLVLGNSWSPPSTYETSSKSSRSRQLKLPTRNSKESMGKTIMSPPLTSSPYPNSSPQASVPRHSLPIIDRGLSSGFLQQPEEGPSRSTLQSAIDHAMEFETRKQELTRRSHDAARAQAQETMVTSSPPVSSSNPHINRRNAALEALKTTQFQISKAGDEPKAPLQNQLSDDDPRKYLLRRQKSNRILVEAGQPPRRLKTSRLPLETISTDAEMHKLKHALTLDMDLLKSSMLVLKIDDYVDSGDFSRGLPVPEPEARTIEDRLAKLLARLKG